MPKLLSCHGCSEEKIFFKNINKLELPKVLSVAKNKNKTTLTHMLVHTPKRLVTKHTNPFPIEFMTTS